MIEQTLYWCIIRDGGHIIAPRQYIDQIDLEQVKIQWKIRYEWRQSITNGSILSYVWGEQ